MGEVRMPSKHILPLRSRQILTPRLIAREMCVPGRGCTKTSAASWRVNPFNVGIQTTLTFVVEVRMHSKHILPLRSKQLPAPQLIARGTCVPRRGCTKTSAASLRVSPSNVGILTTPTFAVEVRMPSKHILPLRSKQLPTPQLIARGTCAAGHG